MQRTGGTGFGGLSLVCGTALRRGGRQARLAGSERAVAAGWVVVARGIGAGRRRGDDCRRARGGGAGFRREARGRRLADVLERFDEDLLVHAAQRRHALLTLLVHVHAALCINRIERRAYISINNNQYEIRDILNSLYEYLHI